MHGGPENVGTRGGGGARAEAGLSRNWLSVLQSPGMPAQALGWASERGLSPAALQYMDIGRRRARRPEALEAGRVLGGRCRDEERKREGERGAFEQLFHCHWLRK